MGGYGGSHLGSHMFSCSDRTLAGRDDA